MRIRALPISEWSTGEVCGHVCKRGSRNRRVSGICVVSTLAVCVRSSLNAGPDDVSSRRWCATNGSNDSSRVEFVHAHASGTRSAAPRGICRVTAIVCCSLRQTSAGNWPPSTHGEPLARVSPEAIDGRERPLVRTYSSGPTDGARGRSRAGPTLACGGVKSEEGKEKPPCFSLLHVS